jgi:endogenous inhibitor of DNA gyrase (YacG/DUF329 family)
MPDDSRARPERSPTCPICGGVTVTDWRPFCSKRCADVDLGRWLRGGYAIPGEPADTPEREEQDSEE